MGTRCCRSNRGTGGWLWFGLAGRRTAESRNTRQHSSLTYVVYMHMRIHTTSAQQPHSSRYVPLDEHLSVDKFRPPLLLWKILVVAKIPTLSSHSAAYVVIHNTQSSGVHRRPEVVMMPQFRVPPYETISQSNDFILKASLIHPVLLMTLRRSTFTTDSSG